MTCQKGPNYPAFEASASSLPKPLLDERPIFDILSAQMQTRVVEIALRIGVFEALAVQRTLDELVRRVEIGSRAAGIIVQVLKSLRLVEGSDGELRLAEIARHYLLERSPFFKGALFNLIPSEEIELLQKHHLQDGTNSPIIAQWLAGKVPDPAGQARAMHAHTFAAGNAFAQYGDFSQVKRVLDVGGGAGTISVALALHDPQIQSMVMDLPSMMPEARKLIQKFEVERQVSFLAVDMFQHEWPSDFDAVVFSNIFHDWKYDRSLHLVKKAFDTLMFGGRIYIIEMLMNQAKDGPLGPALFSAMMLLLMEGEQMSLDEIRSLLGSAGFINVECRSTFGYYSLVTAEKR